MSLPNYDGFRAEDKWGFDFPAVRDALIHVIHGVAKSNKVNLFAHDWGAVFAYMIESKEPELVRSMSTIDVGGRVHVASLSGKVLVPAYQLWLSSAMVIGNTLPFVGKSIGDLMTRACAKYFAHSPTFSTKHGSHVNYPYFYFYKGMVTGGQGGLNSLHKYSPKCPTFYTYGSNKVFHTRARKTLFFLAAQADGCTLFHSQTYTPHTCTHARTHTHTLSLSLSLLPPDSRLCFTPMAGSRKWKHAKTAK